MGLFGPPNIKKMKAKSDVRGLIKAMAYQKNGDVRCAAEGAIAGIGSPAVEPLIAALKDSKWWQREHIVGALGQIGSETEDAVLLTRIVETLINILKTSDVRREAAEALGRIGPQVKDPTLLKRTIEALSTILESKDDHLRDSAVRALGQIGKQLEDTAIREQIIQSLTTTIKNYYGYARHTADEALIQIGMPAIEPLVTLLKHDQHQVRERAAWALEKIGWSPSQDSNGAAYWIARRRWGKCDGIGEASVTPLITVLNDNWTAVTDRMEATIELGKIGGSLKDSALRASIAKRLVDLFRDSESGVRNSAVKALSIMGFHAVEPLIVAIKENLYAAKADNRINVGEFGSAYKQVTALLKDQSISLIAETLIKIGDCALEPLIVALQDNSWSVCSVVAEILGRFKDERAIEPLYHALEYGERGEVRSAAAYALGRMGARGAKLLIDWMPNVYGIDKENGFILEIIGSTNSNEAITFLINLLTTHDTLEYARYRTALALGKTQDKRAIDLLIATLNEPGSYVPGAAARALGEIGDPAAIPYLVRARREQHRNDRELPYDPEGLTEFQRAAADALSKLEESPLDRIIKKLNG